MATYLGYGKSTNIASFPASTDNFYASGQQRVPTISSGMGRGARGAPNMSVSYTYPPHTWEAQYQQPQPAHNQYQQPLPSDPSYYEDIYNQNAQASFYMRGAARGGRLNPRGLPTRGPSAMISRGSGAKDASEEMKSFNEDACKMFIGGLDWDLTADQIHEYFEMFGPVVEVKLKTDIYTGQSRGFAFLLFQRPDSVDKVMEHKNHMILGKRVDPKRAVTTGENNINSRKVFVGGIDPTTTEKEIVDAFSQYGKVVLVELPVDRSSNQRRSFGFVLFESEEAVNQLCQKTKIQLGSKMVDIRKLQSKDELGQGPKHMTSYKKRGLGYNQITTVDQGMYNQAYDYYDHSQAMFDPSYQEQTSASFNRGYRAGPSMLSRNVRGFHPYSR